MSGRLLARLVFVFGCSAITWSLSSILGSPWLAPLVWAIGGLILLRSAAIPVLGLAGLLLIGLVEAGKLWPRVGGPQLPFLLLTEPPPLQLFLLNFFYLPILSFAALVRAHTLAGNFYAMRLFRVPGLRWLCLLLIFAGSLKESASARYQSLRETLVIRGAVRTGATLPLRTAFMWVPVLVRLMILDVLERSEIHNLFRIDLSNWKPASTAIRFSRFDTVLLALGILGIIFAVAGLEL